MPVVQFPTGVMWGGAVLGLQLVDGSLYSTRMSSAQCWYFLKVYTVQWLRPGVCVAAHTVCLVL